MVVCSDERCQKWIKEFMTKINTVLFGIDEESGHEGRIRKLEICIRSKVSKLWLIGTSISIIAILSAVFLPTINAGIRTLNETKTMEIRLTERVSNNEQHIVSHINEVKELETDWSNQIKAMEQNIIQNFDLKMQILEEKYIKKNKED